MDQVAPYGGEYDDLLLEYAERIKKEDGILSQTILAGALHAEVKISLINARLIVDDFCERGVLQSCFGAGPYDEWLTAELEAARRENRGVNATTLAKKLNRESPVWQTERSRSSLQKHIQNASGLADAITIVDDYFARYGLPGVLGPYPLGGVIIVIVAEAVLLLPILWTVHFAVNYVFFGHFTTSTPLVFLLLFFLAERTWNNWKKLRSSKRWAKYDAARARLLSVP